MALRIEDYALIGDCETAALVGKNGSIDWLCWPNFSSDACFASLLGSEDNGYWKIAPTFEPSRVSRKYRDKTLILETTFETKEGSFELVDFMPIRGQNSDIVRIVRGLKGSVAVRMELALRFDFGRIIPWVSRCKDGALQAIAGPDMVMLRTPVEHHGEDMRTVAEFTITEGESIPFVLTYSISYYDAPHKIDPEKALGETQSFWEEWVGRRKGYGPYEDALERSLITLKALTYRPSGGIVAAVTTSLPEALGGSRNWDYRYCWLRDATFTLLALMNAGYYEDARRWEDWLRRSVAGSPDQIQIMYDVKGGRHLLEWEADWLAGYEGSKPVRVGNAASGQLQLDVYGEVLDAFFHAQHGLGIDDPDRFNLPRNMVEHLEKIWQQPDEGIWETRGGAQQFTYSKLMAWVAFDRAIRVAEHGSFEAPLDRWKDCRDTIHREICEKAFDKGLGAFTQYYGSKELDASLLLMPLVGFLPIDDPRICGTVEAIEKNLIVHDLVMRYDTKKVNDGLPPGEGVFLACSFWLVAVWNRMGRQQQARRLFEHLLSLRNDVGLLSEEYDVNQQRLVGNFPQAFSHIALVNAAAELEGAGDTRHRNPKRNLTEQASQA